MRIAFLKPPIGGILGLEMLTFVEPLGAECVAASLEAEGHQCMIVDLRIDGEEAGLEHTRAFSPDLVGLQCNFTTERFRALRLAAKIKQLMPSCMLVVGGHDASRVPDAFHNPHIDAIAVGDGEEIMPAMVDALQHGQSIAAIPGLVINQERSQTATVGHQFRNDLDELPLPARHLIDHYADQYYINFRKPLALMETARGCPYRCNFCSVWKFHKKRFREKSPQRVVEELRLIKAPNVFITDDIFWLDANRGFEMARLIKEAGIKKFFTVQTRTDIICRKPELIEAWKDCGNLAIFLGVEAVSDEGLQRVNKKNSVDNNRKAIELLKDMKVGFTSNFIVDPNWDREDFARLRNWIEETGAYNSGFSVLTPLPGTDLWDSAQKEVTTKNWEMYDIIHTVLPTKLSLEEFYEEYARLWRTSLEVRYRYRGRFRTYFQMGLALAGGKVSLSAVKKGMNIAKVFSRKETFLQAHQQETALEVP